MTDRLRLALSRGAAERDPEADTALEDVARALAGRSRDDLTRTLGEGIAAARAQDGADCDLIAIRARILWAMLGG